MKSMPIVTPFEVDVFNLVPRSTEMDPEERANYFTLVDQLEQEKIVETTS